MEHYIFLNDEGRTFAPDNEFDLENEVENLQVLGIISAKDKETAFKDLLSENPQIIEFGFQNIICYKLDKNFEENKETFYIE